MKYLHGLFAVLSISLLMHLGVFIECRMFNRKLIKILYIFGSDK